MKYYAFLIIIISPFLSSCKKEKAICTANCYSININGKVINGLDNTSVSNVPMFVDWVKFIGLFFTNSKSVTKFTSKSDGTFNESLNVDTSMFRDGYILSFKVKDNIDYMTLPRESNTLSDLSANTFNNINILIYPKTALKIKLNRVQNDNFQYFSVAYYFVDNQDFFPLSVLSPHDINQTELNVFTSADTFTKIRVTKQSSTGINTATIDSIKCIRNITNTFTVNY